MAVNTTLGNKLLDSMVDGGSISFGTPSLDLVFSGGSYPEYKSVKLNVNGIEGKPIMEDAAASSVKNQEIIYFAENETGGTCTATGWKLTMGSYVVSGDFAAPVTIPVNSVPMFRKTDFKLNVT